MQTFGIYAQGDSDMSITNLDVDWDAGGKGAAIYSASTGEVEVLDATIDGNILKGIEALSSAGSGFELRRSKISTAGPAIVNGGSGGYFHAFDVLARSTAQPEGIGVVMLGNGSAFTANHMTIVGSGGQFRFGVLASASSGVINAELSNTIIASTGANFQLGIYGEESGAAPFAGVVTVNSIVPSAFGDNVVIGAAGVLPTSVPRFVGPSDFRLKPNQVAIDASVGAESDTVDANGAGRPVDGDDSGSAVSDLGAFEYQRRAPETDVLGPSTLAPSQEGEFDARGTFDADGDDMTYEWDFGDGSPVDTSGLVVHHSYSPGKFILKFTALDESGESDTTTLEVTVPTPVVPGGIFVGPPAIADTTPPNVTIGKVKPNKKGTAFSTTLTCPASETRCTITVSYTAKTGKTGKAKKFAKDVSVTLAGGKSATVTLKINSAGLKLIENKGVIKGTVIINATDASNNAKTQPLKYSAKAGKTGSAK